MAVKVKSPFVTEAAQRVQAWLEMQDTVRLLCRDFGHVWEGEGNDKTYNRPVKGPGGGTAVVQECNRAGIGCGVWRERVINLAGYLEAGKSRMHYPAGYQFTGEEYNPFGTGMSKDDRALVRLAIKARNGYGREITD
jgi:hypothetical protein